VSRIGTRGPRPAHSREDVAAAAVELAEAEGLDAISMRKVAARLGAGTTSLYRYVSSRDDILDLALDAMRLRYRPPAPTGDRRADLTALADRTRAMILRHPWLAPLIAGRLRWMEAWLAALDGTGLDADELLLGAMTVQTFVGGAVLAEVAQRQAGFDQPRWLAAQEPLGTSIIEGNEYPRVARVMVEASAPHDGSLAERTYRLGLSRILDGILGAK
jgi:AcrR family transcriptional regulator